jgi:hypothetical protein
MIYPTTLEFLEDPSKRVGPVCYNVTGDHLKEQLVG